MLTGSPERFPNTIHLAVATTLPATILYLRLTLLAWTRRCIRCSCRGRYDATTSVPRGCDFLDQQFGDHHELRLDSWTMILVPESRNNGQKSKVWVNTKAHK